MTKTEAIIAYDRATAKGSELTSIAKYLAKTTEKGRRDYLRRYPRIGEELRNL